MSLPLRHLCRLSRPLLTFHNLNSSHKFRQLNHSIRCHTPVIRRPSLVVLLRRHFRRLSLAMCRQERAIQISLFRLLHTRGILPGHLYHSFHRFTLHRVHTMLHPARRTRTRTHIHFRTRRLSRNATAIFWAWALLPSLAPSWSSWAA